MAKQTPYVKDTQLFAEYEGVHELMFDIVTNWDLWQHWLNLETTKSFRYIRPDGAACTVIKEMRVFFGSKKMPVWIAHKRLKVCKGDYRLKRLYIGVSENVTHRKLRSVSFRLSQRKLFVS